MSNWYYYNEQGEKISVTGGQLKGLAKTGLITPETIIETECGKSAQAGKVKGLTFGTVPQPKTVKPVEPTPFIATVPTANQTISQTAPQSVTVPVAAGGKSSLLVTLVGVVAISGVAFAGWKIIEFTSPPVEQAKEIAAVPEEKWVEESLNVEADEVVEDEGMAQNQPVDEPVAKEDGDVVREVPVNHNQFTATDQEAISKFVAMYGDDVRTRNRYGETRLHRAATDGNFAAARFLVFRGANVNIACNGGMTPLHIAASNGHLEIVKFLISRGANVNALAFSDRSATARDLAWSGGEHREVIEYLDSVGGKTASGIASMPPITLSRRYGETRSQFQARVEEQRASGQNVIIGESEASTILGTSTPSRPTPTAITPTSSSSTANTPTTSTNRPASASTPTSSSASGNQPQTCRSCSGTGRTTIQCTTCRGSGTTVTSTRGCLTCRGTGRMTVGSTLMTCGTCQGTGGTPPVRCSYCGGRGTREITCIDCTGQGTRR